MTTKSLTEGVGGSSSDTDLKYPLKKFGVSLNKLAKDGKLDECFGRDEELSLLLEILARKQKNNPVLVGEAGVGKTAIVENFALKLVRNDVPFIFMGRNLVSLSLTKLVAGAKYRGQFEDRFSKVIQEIKKDPKIILFIDEIHTLVGAGNAEGSLDAANILKPALSRGGFQLIGATTLQEYTKLEKDPALNRRFQPILVKEPTVDETIAILLKVRPNLEFFHNIIIPGEVVNVTAKLASNYLKDRFLPDKALDLLDRASAREVVKVTSTVKNDSVVHSLVNDSLRKLNNVKIEAFRKGDVSTQYILQEIDYAYKNFLLKWLKHPKDVLTATKDEKINTNFYQPTKEKTNSLLFNIYNFNKKTAKKVKNRNIADSKISASLYNKMHETIMARVNQLMQASIEPRKEIKKIVKYGILSEAGNTAVISNFLKSTRFSRFNKKRIHL